MDNIIVNIQRDSVDKAAESMVKFGRAAQDAGTQVEGLEDKTKQANDEQKRFNDETGKAEKKLRDFSNITKEVASGQLTAKRALQEVKQAMVELALQNKTNTKQYQDLKQIAGELQDTLSDVSEEFRQAGSDTRGIDIAIRTMNVGVSVATGLQGATALLGIQSKALDQVLVGLNASMLVSNSLQQISSELARKDSIFSMAAAKGKQLWAAATNFVTSASLGLKLALGGIAFAAIAALVYGLVKAYQALGGQLSENLRLAKLDAESRSEAAGKVKDEVASMYELVAVAKNENLSRKDRQAAIDKLQAQYPEYLKNINLESINTEAVNQAIRNQIDLMIKREQLRILAQKKAELDLQIENNDAVTEQISLYDKLKATLLTYFGAYTAGANAAVNAFDKTKAGLQQQSDDITKQIENILNTLGASPFATVTAETKKNLEEIKGEGGSINRLVQEEVRLRIELATLTRVQRDEARRQKDLEGFLRKLDERIELEKRITEAVRERGRAEQKVADEQLTGLEKWLGMSRKQFDSEFQYRVAAAENLYGNILQFATDVDSAIIAGSRVRTENEIANLELRKQRGVINEKEYQRELNKIKNEQAIKEKKAAVAEAFLKIPLIILQTLASVPFPASIVAATITGALATVQAGILAARPPAQFFKGVIDLPLNGNPRGRDTIPAMLNEGESVMTTDETKKYKDALWAMRKGEFDQKYIAHEKLLKALPKLMPDLAFHPNLPAVGIDSQMEARIGIAIKQSIAPELQKIEQAVREELGYVQNDLKDGNSDRRRLGRGMLKSLTQNRKNG